MTSQNGQQLVSKDVDDKDIHFNDGDLIDGSALSSITIVKDLKIVITGTTNGEIDTVDVETTTGTAYNARQPLGKDGHISWSTWWRPTVASCV